MAIPIISGPFISAFEIEEGKWAIAVNPGPGDKSSFRDRIVGEVDVCTPDFIEAIVLNITSFESDA